jgi:hypothetical protein
MATNQRGVFIIYNQCEGLFPDTKSLERKNRQKEITGGIIKEENRSHCDPDGVCREKQSARLR